MNANGRRIVDAHAADLCAIEDDCVFFGAGGDWAFPDLRLAKSPAIRCPTELPELLDDLMRIESDSWIFTAGDFSAPRRQRPLHEMSDPKPGRNELQSDEKRRVVRRKHRS